MERKGQGNRMLKVGLLGYGRTGKVVADYLMNKKDVALKFIIKNKPLKHPSDIIFTHFDLGRCIETYKPDVLIDFTTKDATIANLAILAEVGFKKGIVIATTGFNNEELEIMRNYSQKFSIIWAPNITSGINLLIRAAKMIRDVWKDSDIHIIEEHFQQKKDVSGTALRIKDSLDKGEIISIRSGGTVGVHKVIFGRENQKIEITHQSHSRYVFAAGALRLARWLKHTKRGFYRTEDYIDHQIDSKKGEINED
jgi:4-hydroxy-tetrahydrodipicolinate reductase